MSDATKPVQTGRALRWGISALLVLSALLLTSTRTYTPVHATISWTGGSASGSGAVPWQPFDGPVNMRTGNLMVQADGPSFPGVNGLDEVISPVYNSVSAANATDLGKGWILGTGRDVGLLLNGSTATFYDETGYGWAFTRSGGAFTAPAGIDAQLVQNPDGTYTLTDDASGLEHQFDSGGYLTALQNREGNRISFTYDGSGRLTSITNTEGQVTTIGYDGQNRISTITDFGSPARTWTYGYDGSNDLTQVTDPDGGHVNYGYDAGSHLTSITDRKGNQTLISYGSYGVSQVVAVTDPSARTGPTWTYTFESTHATNTVDDPLKVGTEYLFDGYGMLSEIEGGGLGFRYYTFNADNHLTQYRSPVGNSTNYTYDANNNLTSVTLPTGAAETLAYGNTSFPYLPTSVTDMQGNTSAIQYTAQGLVSSVTDALNHTSSATYNTNGTVATTTDQDGNQTTYSYNTLGLLSGVSYAIPQGQSQSPLGSGAYSYDSYDRVSGATDGKGQATGYSYDSMDDLLAASYADGGSVVYTYDQNGNVLTMTDGTGETTYSYNALDQQTQKVLPHNQTVDYTWDGMGDLLTKQDSGGTVTYTYSAAGKLSTVTDRQGNQISVGYDGDGNLSSLGFPNKVTESMTYNSADQLTLTKAYYNALTPLTSLSYTYTNPATNKATGMPYSEVNNVAKTTTAYTYDAGNRLTNATQTDNSSHATLHSWGYGYDPAGNRTSQALDGVNSSFSYNVVNQLTQATGGVNKTYSYDGNGALTGTSSGMSLTYNAAGQTTSITPPGHGPTIAMAYTGQGQGERVSAGTTSYQYDLTGQSVATAVGSSTYTTTLPDGTLLDEYTGGNTYYYVTDGQGSVVGLTSPSGTTLADQYSYDPSGNAVGEAGTVPNQFTYLGMTYDSSTGLYYTGGGYYDPSTGLSTCHDVGPTDPGEDICGEDEGASLGPSGPMWTETSQILSAAPTIVCGVLGRPTISVGKTRIVTARVRGFCAGSGTTQLSVHLYLERVVSPRGGRPREVVVEGTVGRCNITVAANSVWQCPPANRRPASREALFHGRYNICVNLYGQFPDGYLPPTASGTRCYGLVV